ncbi:hypothetical protein E3N88_12957 [Mikania micrantha]|uniref:RING-type E3 ubiquitin transferase n=1 Tax=Mikania micrantha TaxID=192012 RepID=A0A5N6P891_9ASTR|nr:hypothetical protein E3N88_12957 [Mikania micrantha]
MVEQCSKCIRREAFIRKDEEEKALQDSREKQKLQNAINGSSLRYQEFTWEEIVSACSSFSEDLIIGTGGNGTVYKSSFHHTVAAVKVLQSQEAHGTKQFKQESMAVWYMSTWKTGVWTTDCFAKMAHHRSRGLISSISRGDVGLSTMLQLDVSSTSTIYKDTSPAGTPCYIDPEYQRTGLVSPKSDVYALGMVILQLLTARPVIAVTHVVETTLENGELASVLDPDAGEWLVNETKELAILGLSCAELRRKDRPNLKN